MLDGRPDLRARAVLAARGLLEGAIRRSALARRVAERAASELERALLARDLYGPRYFKTGVDVIPGAKSVSGYTEYTRQSSKIDVGAYIVFKHLHPGTVLDVGAATGFLVEALGDCGVEAWGIDVSHDAVASAPEPVRHRMAVASATHLPVRSGAVEVATAFETLEHVPPRAVSRAVRELARVASRFVVATIPSFGPNPHGPDGWVHGKVRWEQLDHYLGLGPGYEGPVPFPDLMRDADGNPIEGHLTIASFAWWTRRFSDAGLVRCGEVEERMNEDLDRYGLIGEQIWNLYVFRRPEAEVPGEALASELARMESVLRLPPEE